MLFHSYSFLIFFPVVVLIYGIIPKKLRYLWLLVASYYFYMCWNPAYAVLIALSTVITWLSGLLIAGVNQSDCEEDRKVKRKKLVVTGSFVVNLSILCLFKYMNFFLDNINFVLGKLHITMIQSPFHWLLPVGISFYTFQALSYTMDVYREEIEPEKNLFRYALFVSFFPQLVAGPIERSKNLLSQLRNVENMRIWDYDRMTGGLTLMLWGFFQKLVIADRISILVDTVFDSYYLYGSIQLILAAVCFAIQIYCDFSSYSIIAIGAARVMGFNLMENFNTPYFAESVQDFWRRWHISLSSWFRDYLYIPLGGSRCSKVKKYRNILLTFLVSGLWHGANWTYVIWGGLHGLYQIIGAQTAEIREKIGVKAGIRKNNISYHLGKMIITFVLVDFAWIFFRANNVSDAFSYIIRMFSQWNPWVLFDKSLYELGLDYTEISILLTALIVLFCVSLIRRIKQQTIEVFLKEQNLWFRWGVLFVLLIMIMVYGKYGPMQDAQAFIYFQF